LSVAEQGASGTERYVSLVREALYSPAGQYLFAVDGQDLAARKAWIVTARAGSPNSTLIGACHFALDDGVLWLRGLLVSTEARGLSLASAIGSFGLRELSRAGVDFEAVRAAVIVYNQLPNPNSVRALAKIGFGLTYTEGVVELSGDHRDRHLFPYSERIEGVVSIRYRLLDLSLARLPAAKHFLGLWRG